jgi:cytochrome c oxidase subunit 4
MSESHSVEDIKKHRKVYYAVFFALLIGTIVTVALRHIHFPAFWITVAVALFVATIKATLVACYFMHLISERKAIYSTLVITVFFFAAMMFLFIYTRTDVPRNTEFAPTMHVPHGKPIGQ